MNIPRLSDELARRMYPESTPKDRIDLVDILMRAATTAEIVGRHDVAAQRRAEATGFLDIRTSQVSGVLEYVQFGNVPEGTTRETVLAHVDTIFERQGVSRMDDNLFTPAVLYRSGNRIVRVDVTVVPHRQYLFATVQDTTERYALCRSIAPLAQE